ncbi:MAG: hypothetical protein ACR2Q4_05410 [Geminicoccaceae bacterium]
MRKTLSLLIPAIGLSLTACVIDDPNVGTGPIELSAATQEHFEAYKKERTPGFFAVAVDGHGAFYDYCPDGRCYRSSSNDAIYRCKKANDKECKIYASKGNIVWKTDPEAAEN